MKSLALLLFVMFVCTCSAQSIEKRYRSSRCESGILNFFRPMKLTKLENISKFVYDMTYISNADSITVNFTTNIEKPLNIVMLELCTDKVMTVNNTPLILYRDVLDSSYEIRLSTVFSVKEIEKLFQSEIPISFIMTLSDGSLCKATYNKSKWEKEKNNITRIFQSIKL